MEQITVDIEGIRVPLVKQEGVAFYPVTFIEKHILMRGRGSFTVGIKNEDKVKLEVDFSEWDGGIQYETNCVSGEVLGSRLERTQHRRLTQEQKLSQNKIHRYLGIKELDLEAFEWDEFDAKWLDQYDEYTRGIVERMISKGEITLCRKCRVCEAVLPLLNNFFHKEAGGRTFSGNCKRCESVRSEYTSDDEYEDYLKGRDISVVQKYRNGDVIGLFEAYSNNVIGRLPDIFYTRSNLNEIILYMVDSGKISKDNLTQRLLQDEYRLYISNYENTNITEVYQYLYGEEFYLDKWRYPKYTFSSEIELTKELSVEIFDRYLKEHDIIIDDPFGFDYQEVISACTLGNILKTYYKGLCGFFVYYWKGKYAGYQFRELGNYYKSDNNVLSDLKFLAEKQLGLQIEKIPLYITLGMIHTNHRNIYNYIRKDGRSLFYWFNLLYPDKFIESDFTVGRYRNEFDSIEEQQVDGVLREYFDNVIYNYNTSGQVVELKGKRPDWFIMTEKGVWLVEYFGMYIEKQKQNPIIRDYIETTHDKIKLYDEMSGYNFLLVYPSDIEKGFLGLRAMLEELKVKVG